jgi:FdhD protein
MPDRVAIAAVTHLGPGELRREQDLVAIEAPLSVELTQANRPGVRSLGMLMRTPGDDDDLVVGLLHTEGVIRWATDVVAMTRRPSGGSGTAASTVMDVTVAAHVDLDRVTADRATVATSACGLCGRLVVQGLDALAGRAHAPDVPAVSSRTIASLPITLRAQQAVFAETGGLHAAGLFDTAGRLLVIREDVGRHNAVDKLVGAALRAGWLPADDRVLAVSGRVAFEIVQKAVMAGIAIVVAVGAPSSLAIDAARAANVTVVGFARDEHFNVYSGTERIQPA